MNFGVIGPGDIGEVIIRKLRDAGLPSQNGKFARPRVTKIPRDENGRNTGFT